ncbi:ABC transporter permease [Azoarcus sp. DN11]|uniref:MlaE family ABC transporter permease n=1 Tax=Azoarcus sp. DN11 TaxID=356837 RepID=UPI000EB25979|nr:ABC transporter permease [Azoarcus sp. DN11]AYH42946.1 ABC transporter permease [Azoarcus sp. DN11]
MSKPAIAAASATVTIDGNRLRLSGDWIVANYTILRSGVTRLHGQVDDATEVDLERLGALDTAGVSLLHELLGGERLARLASDASPLPPARRALLKAVSAILDASAAPAAGKRGYAFGDITEHAGIAMLAFYRHVIDIAGFIGITLETAFFVLFRPRRWRITSLAAHVESTAVDAVPIVALLTFLVGAVVAFLGATVLAEFGASIFTVDLIAFSFLREFGPLLTAIIVAGRTASAFTAQIGSMRANEEIDAIRVGGLNPVELLVVPRVAALLLALPMLSFVAMIAGIAGGMLVCAAALDISPTMFLSILESHVGVRHFVIGMVKAPVFAYLIAVIGCLEGFKVSGSAQSVGEHTTSAVVQSIFIVIVVDAVAAMFCMEMGW